MLAPDLVRVCGGILGVAGVLSEKADMVKQALGDLTLIQERPEGDWVSMEFSR